MTVSGIAAEWPGHRNCNPLVVFLESSVKPLVFLAVLLSALLVITGCASTPSGAVPIGNISDLPQTMLSGAKLDHARSVAMGTARTKGWTIKSAAPNQLLLERELPATSPQASALGSTAAPPKIEVQTDLVERSDGTIVALKAFVISNPGTPDEKRIDYTSDYENQLLISLSSLQSAWIDSRGKIASTVPIPTEQDMAQQNESQDAPAAVDSIAQPIAATAPEAPPTPTPAVAPAPAPAPQPVAAATAQAAAAVAPQSAPAQAASSTMESASALPAASGDGLPRGVTPAVPTASNTPPRNDMLVLNNSGRKGLWAYYAEDYARLRGCAIGDRGATLLQETPVFELHEVPCVGAANVLVKCQGGVCQGVR